MRKEGRTDFQHRVKMYIQHTGIGLDARGAAKDHGKGEFLDGKVPSRLLKNKLQN
jgi:hypothetical protein